MAARPYVIEVIYSGGWKIEFDGKSYGPYASKDEAVTTATTWVENARRQGHDVTFTVSPRPSLANGAHARGDASGRGA